MSQPPASPTRPVRRISKLNHSADAEWITLRHGADMMGLSPSSFKRVQAASDIRRLEYPGLAPLYSRQDIERVVKEAVQKGPRKPHPRGSKESS